MNNEATNVRATPIPAATVAGAVAAMNGTVRRKPGPKPGSKRKPNAAKPGPKPKNGKVAVQIPYNVNQRLVACVVALSFAALALAAANLALVA